MGVRPLPPFCAKRCNVICYPDLLCQMLVQVRLLPGAISDLFAQVSSSGQITVADQYGLMAALLEDAITEEERDSIDRLLHAFCRGRMKVVSEISALSWQYYPSVRE